MTKYLLDKLSMNKTIDQLFKFYSKIQQNYVSNMFVNH